MYIINNTVIIYSIAESATLSDCHYKNTD